MSSPLDRPFREPVQAGVGTRTARKDLDLRLILILILTLVLCLFWPNILYDSASRHAPVGWNVWFWICLDFPAFTE